MRQRLKKDFNGCERILTLFTAPYHMKIFEGGSHPKASSLSGPVDFLSENGVCTRHGLLYGPPYGLQVVNLALSYASCLKVVFRKFERNAAKRTEESRCDRLMERVAYTGLQRC